ncbi:MAG: ATP-binding cassette domain-containing protein [Myxococcales bacterium]|nr:MAG: ATP-binding cassette domain-containing protein [Myxococcales bacterium]
MSGPLPVEIVGLSHSVGKGEHRRRILREVDASIPAGEIVIVTGPSGSGKTTLLTLVGALRAAQEGSVRVLGEELRGAPTQTLERVRSRIGFVFQSHNLVEALSALENVELGLRVQRQRSRSEIRRLAAEMLDAVGLASQLHPRPESLSGGQRQRVAIARPLAAQPSLLLADEPTASLDRASGREVVDRMQALARERGATILLVTHDNRVLDVADRILHLEDGGLSNFTDAVIANTQHMMHLLALTKRRQDLGAAVEPLDEKGFVAMLEELTGESERFLESTALAGDEAFQGMLSQALSAFTRKLAQVLDAERASFFLVDAERAELVLRVSQDVSAEQDVRIPLGSGIAGAVASNGAPVRIDDAYADPRFNPEIDRRTGFRTRSVLAMPVRDRQGQIFGVAQLLNRRDGRPFDPADEQRFARFAAPLGLILESWQRLDRWSRSRI